MIWKEAVQESKVQKSIAREPCEQDDSAKDTRQVPQIVYMSRVSLSPRPSAESATTIRFFPCWKEPERAGGQRPGAQFAAAPPPQELEAAQTWQMVMGRWQPGRPLATTPAVAFPPDEADEFPPNSVAPQADPSSSTAGADAEAADSSEKSSLSNSNAAIDFYRLSQQHQSVKSSASSEHGSNEQRTGKGSRGKPLAR